MIVIDASVALKWILSDEVYSDKAFNLYKNHIEEKETLLVPTLLFLEIANTLVTKSRLNFDEVKSGLKFFYKANLNTKTFDYKDIYKTSRLARKYNTSVYDMLYAVIAQREKALLVTADDKFIAKTKFKFVIHLKET